MKLFPFVSALLFTAFAENAWSSEGPTKSQREEAAPTGKLRTHSPSWKTQRRQA
jgi:hypothetical protein